MNLPGSLIKFVFSIVLLGGVFYYEYASLQLLGANEVWERTLTVFQLLVEFVVFIQSILIIIGIIDLLNDQSADFELIETLTEYPDVDIIIPIRRVDPSILETTLLGVQHLTYPNEKIHLFIADDTPESELSEKYLQLSNKYKATYIYDPTNTGFKAGMLNIAIPKVSSEYIAFFDYDQVPTPWILTHMIGLLQQYPTRAFVQAKKTFRELTNLSKVWSALLYLQFFEVFERSKNRSNSVLFAGSTACFRRSTIDEVGGIPDSTFTEDNNLTLQLLFHNYEGLFTNTVGSIGLVPPTFDLQISQLWRWSHGGTHTLSSNFIKLLSNKNLNLTQRLEFISTLGITPILVLIYLYTISFVPQFINGVDSLRPSLGPVSAIILVPLSVSLTYVIFAFLAIWFDRSNPGSEFSFKHLPGFTIIAVASNFLIFTSGLAGIFGLFGPKSKDGRWTRKIPIKQLGVLSFILSVILITFGVIWLLQGLTSAIIIIIIGFTLLPTLFVVLYYQS